MRRDYVVIVDQLWSSEWSVVTVAGNSRLSGECGLRHLLHNLVRMLHGSRHGSSNASNPKIAAVREEQS